ncbi:MAG TPA: GGDEF domain-containing protein [Candidatus Faecimonas gallistercoris]|nr:GGDEF domain-containing protein [Candidatus Faecimonas gallistercoris]
MKKKLLIIIPIIIALLTFVFVYRYYNKEDETTTLTVREKQWVQENEDKTYDFEVVNDYPLYGLNGEGVIFNFLDDFEDNIGLEFNRIPYLKDSKPSTDSFRIRILDNDEKIGKKDLLLFNDNYVAVGKTYERINSIKDFKNTTFGIFKEDSSEISYYLKSGTNLSYKNYDDIKDLYKALDDDEVDMIIVPNIMYLSYTIENDKYSINYFFTEMQKQIVLTLTKDNDELNEIVTKYYNKWKQTKYVEEYNNAYLEYYLEANDLDAKTKADLISKNYTYGYVENSPYEKMVNGKVAGIAGEYVDRVARLSGITFKYKGYDTIQELKKAIDKGEVDLYFDYYNYNNEKYKSTLSTFIEKYVVLGKENDNHIVTSFESMKADRIAMLGGDSLYNYFSNNARAKIKTYDNIDDLVKNSGSRLIVVDQEIYTYYQNNKFKNLKLLYTDTMLNDYKFMVKNNNEAFYDLFNYIINTNSYYNYRNSGIANLNASILEGSTFEQVYTIVLTIIFVPLIILLIIYLIIKKKKQIKKVKTSDRHKYTDMLTSLKNRNYLNAKMPEWEESKVYPQAIVMVDLNNVKYINDNYGHEEGDELIIKAASILVNTQLENSEIVRTDGNEFLIYLVGYSERQVATYVKKLGKEMKNLPHEFGAAIGYSMITDEIKTLDDAINEATLEMITAKEEMK